MLTAEERYQLLEEASALSGEWKYGDTVARLEALETAELIAEPELVFLLAQAHYRCGDHQRAAILAEALKKTGVERGKDRLYCRRLLLEGNLQVERGQLDAARQSFLEVFSLAASSSDKRLVAASTLNLGIICWLVCDYREGLAGLRRAIVAYEELGDSYHLAASHHNLGMVYKEIGLLSEAEAQLETARRYYTNCGTDREIVFTEYERALVLHMRGQLQVGLRSARRALRKVEELNLPREVAEACRVLGIIWRDCREFTKARRFFDRGLALAVAVNATMLEAELHEESAMLQAEKGAADAAIQEVGLAAEMYRSMGATVRAARAKGRVESRLVDPAT